MLQPELDAGGLARSPDVRDLRLPRRGGPLFCLVRVLLWTKQVPINQQKPQKDRGHTGDVQHAKLFLQDEVADQQGGDWCDECDG